MAKNRPSHISRPVYPGGLAAMKKFVAAHLKYPPAALKAKVEGTVVIRYTLDYTGKVTATKVKSGLGHGCDAEAERVVRLMRFTVPQSSKKKVRIHQDLNVHFKLPKKKAKPAAAPIKPASPGTGQPVRIVYSQSGVVSGRVVGKQEDKKKDGSSGYSYTIKW